MSSALQPPDPIRLSTFTRRDDVVPRVRSLPWAVVTRSLSRHDERGLKDGALFSPAVFQPPRRANANVQGISLAVHDQDHEVDLDAIQTALDPYHFVLYTTFSSTPEDLRIRAIIAYSRAISRAEHPDIWQRCHEHLFGGVSDRAASAPSEAFYLPSCRPGAHRLTVVHDGRALDPEELPPASRPTAERIAINWSGARRTLLTDAEIVDKAMAARNGAKFSRLWRGDMSEYPSPSEADQALTDLLTFWARDPAQVERVFARSALARRPKWEGRPGYRLLTLAKAADFVTAGYGQ